MRRILKLIAVALTVPGLYHLYQAGAIFIESYGLGTPDNLGYGIAFFFLIIAAFFLGLAYWLYLIAIRPK